MHLEQLFEFVSGSFDDQMLFSTRVCIKFVHSSLPPNQYLSVWSLVGLVSKYHVDQFVEGVTVEHKFALLFCRSRCIYWLAIRWCITFLAWHDVK